MRQLIFSWFFLLTAALPAQEKGAAPLAGPSTVYRLPSTVTRAVVVGISDYQDPGIPDLRFADRDAEAFATWLRSPAGGAVPEENIRLLTNEKATVAQVSLALIDWLIEETKEGDRVVIYYSGHGEMEARLLNQLGYLLLWDSPAHISLAGALPVDILKQVVTTLSVDKKANVLVVADACRAGKLAASDVIGSQLTNANLIKQFAGEQKILSCQANEYSVEGEQWGGGRGVFSYFLINGLYGMADLDSNRQITLMEIERFLQDHVPEEVMPVAQIPLTTGDKKTTVAKVEEGLLEKVRKGEDIPFANFSSIEQRGLVQETLAKSDSAIVGLFLAFQKALNEKRFLEPAENCAEAFYNRLLQEPGIAPLHNYLRRNYAAALMDDGQQAINRWMKSDFREFSFPNKNELLRRYAPYPRLLERAAQLLGAGHYFYAELQARKQFFEGFLICPPISFSNNLPEVRQAIGHYKKSLDWRPDFPMACLALSDLYPKLRMRDSTCHFAFKALESAPRWLLALDRIFEVYWINFENAEKALPFLETARQLDSNWIWLWIDYGHYYEEKRLFEQAEAMFLKAIALDTTYFLAYQRLGGLYDQYLNRDKEAEQLWLKALSLEPNDIQSLESLANFHFSYEQFDLAFDFYARAVELDPGDDRLVEFMANTYSNTRQQEKGIRQIRRLLLLPNGDHAGNHLLIGRLFLQLNEPDSARLSFEKCLQLEPERFHGSLGMALLSALEGDTDTAFFWLEKAAGLLLPSSWFDNAVLNPLKPDPRFQTLLSKVYAREIGEYRHTLSVHPDDYFTAFRLFELLVNTGQFAQADTVFKQNSDHMIVERGNATGWAYFYQGQYKRAEYVFKKILDLSPDNPFALNGLGWAIFRQGRLDEAESAFLKVLEKHPDLIGVLNGLGQIYEQTGRLEEAIRAFDKYVELSPDVGYGYFRLGIVLTKAKRFAEAEAACLKSIELDQNRHEWYLGLAFLRTSEGKHAEALQQAEQAILKKATFQELQNHFGLAPLRTLPEWKVLMKKYFPDQVRD